MNQDKGASIIHTCRTCGSFRQPEIEPDGCPTCASLNRTSHFTDAHVLCDLSDDSIRRDDSLESMLIEILAAGESKEA